MTRRSRFGAASERSPEHQADHLARPARVPAAPLRSRGEGSPSLGLSRAAESAEGVRRAARGARALRARCAADRRLVCGRAAHGRRLPGRLSGPPAFFASLHFAAPHDMATVEVRTVSGVHPYLALSPNAILWRAHARDVSFFSWSPLANDPLRARFGRILLRPCGLATQTQLADALLALRERLSALGFASIPLLDGDVGAAVWIPFCDGPPYLALALWLQGVAEAAAARYPSLLATCVPQEAGNRIHLSVGTNHPGRFSSPAVQSRRHGGARHGDAARLDGRRPRRERRGRCRDERSAFRNRGRRLCRSRRADRSAALR